MQLSVKLKSSILTGPRRNCEWNHIMLKSLIYKIKSLYDPGIPEVKEVQPHTEAPVEHKLFCRGELPFSSDKRVKALKFIKEHPTTNIDRLRDHMNKNVIDKLNICGMLSKVTLNKRSKKKKPVVLVTISEKGKEILDQSRHLQDAVDFINVVQKTQCKSLDEFDLLMTLFGDRKWVDPEFLRSIATACWNNGKCCLLADDVDRWIALKLQSRIPFAKEIVEKMSDYGTDFMTSYSPIENVPADHMNESGVVVNTIPR